MPGFPIVNFFSKEYDVEGGGIAMESVFATSHDLIFESCNRFQN